ncbi:unnamed protein product [Hermetia illucens]|uniref:Polyhomeotic-like protein 2 n=1 Tax=Hermetia illucens TaxID=343691 RepID=A0A7R8UBC0_HERIL|nr:unnamed protein product [Hermetia illucens]
MIFLFACKRMEVKDSEKASVESGKEKQNEEISLKKPQSTNVPKAEKDLPKAMIKPNVLTHVIEGFVIQESNEPFAVTRQRYAEKDSLGEPPKKKSNIEESSTPAVIPPDSVACEHCGKYEHRSKLKKKRFCSLTCARAPKNSPAESNTDNSTTQPDESVPMKTVNAVTSEATPSLEKVATTTETAQKPESGSDLPLMIQWTVSDVCEFIKNIPGCSDYAEEFAAQEIDGQALLLLNDNHLVTTMGVRLGPALKIVAKVQSMKEGVEEREQQ